MPTSTYPPEYNFICLHCWRDESQCPDIRLTARNRANCPLLKVVKSPPTDEQIRTLKKIIGLRGYKKEYQDKHLARMMVIQAERNALPPNSVTTRPVSPTLGSVESQAVS